MNRVAPARTWFAALGVVSASVLAPAARAQTAPAPPPHVTAVPCPPEQVAPDGRCLAASVPAQPSVVPAPAPAAAPAAAAPSASPPIVVAPPPVTADTAARRNALLTGGIALFAVGYVATIAVNYGVCGDGAVWRGCDSKGLSFVPVAGSFYFAGLGQTEASYRVLAVTLGVSQVAGVALAAWSLLAPSGSGSARQDYVLPMVVQGGGGALYARRF